MVGLKTLNIEQACVSVYLISCRVIFLFDLNSLSYAMENHNYLFKLGSKAPKTEEGYDPKKSKVSEDRMEKWRTSEVTGDIIEVPGIGPAAKKLLAEDAIPEDRITNTHQLIGHYLKLKGPDGEDEVVTIAETNQKFWYWLKLKGIASHRSAIVLAVAEKCATFFPGFHDANAVEYDDEEY